VPQHENSGTDFSCAGFASFSAMPTAVQQHKFETPTPPGVATPDIVETSIGTLHLSDGYSDPGTVTAFLYFQGYEYNFSLIRTR
jgi:hypothetical protein